jgi:hypothetical protein
MPDDPRTLSVTYSSGIYIRKPEVLSTMAVFYDQVWLPYPYGFEKEGIWFRRDTFSGLQSHRQFRDDIYSWTAEWGPLYDQGILRTLPPPIPPGDIFSAGKEVVANREGALNQIYGKLIDQYEGIHVPYSVGVTEEIENLSLALHAAYAHKVGPELFISDPTATASARLAGFLVRSLFEYRFPELQGLTAEQIVEVRDYIKDTKEGFVDYIFQTVDDVEARLKSGDKSEEGAARKTVERKLVPWYDELCRQLKSKKAGFWANVLAAGAKFLKIDATPWTPKFYGDLFEIFGSMDEVTKAKAEAQSNASQAFQYLARMESNIMKASSDNLREAG